MVLKVIEDMSVVEEEDMQGCPCGLGCATRCYRKEYEELLRAVGIDDKPRPVIPPKSITATTSEQKLVKPNMGEMFDRGAYDSGNQSEDSQSSTSRSGGFIGADERKRAREDYQNHSSGGKSVVRKVRRTSRLCPKEQFRKSGLE